MEIAVIGGSGFIGSHVVDKLIEEGHEVTIFDIMKPHREGIRHLYLDLFDFNKLMVALAGKYEVYYLLAAMSNVNHILKSPLQSSLVNVQGTVNVLEAARIYGCRVIFASTVWVYMLANSVDVCEETPLLVQNVNHSYTASKVAAELFILSYSKLYNLNYTILRYGIPYGPRGREGTVITNFVKRAINGNKLIINGDGSQYRNFIYVEDLAEGNVLALNNNANNSIINLDGSRPISIKEVAENVIKHFPNITIEYQKERSGDFIGRIASNMKAEKILGWKPKTDLENGIKKYIEWIMLKK